MWAALTAIFGSIPAIERLLNRVLEIVNAAIVHQQAEAALEKLKEANKKAHDTKDTKDLEDRFRGGSGSH